MTTTENREEETASTNGARRRTNGHDTSVAASQFLGGLLQGDELAKEQFTAARLSVAELSGCQKKVEGEGKVEGTAKQARKARERAQAARNEHDPHGRRRVPPTVAFAGAVVLAILDIVPAWMAAQSLDLDNNDTVAVAVLIVVALAGAMALLDTGERRPDHRQLLRWGVGVGFVILFLLRMSYLLVTGVASVPVAVLASAALTVISALLVVFGSALLSHRKPAEVARTEYQAKAAARKDGEAQAALKEATDAAVRTRGALMGTATVEARRVGPPEGLDPEAFVTAVRTQIDRDLQS